MEVHQLSLPQFMAYACKIYHFPLAATVFELDSTTGLFAKRLKDQARENPK